MTPSVKSWIGQFLTNYRLRFECDDWPQLGTEPSRQHVLCWFHALTAEHVTEEEADAASFALRRVPPQMRQDHLTSFIAMVKQLREQEKATQTVEAVRAARTARVQTQEPIPRPPGFRFQSWRDWVRHDCPEFILDDTQNAGA